MKDDPIISEIRETRKKISAKFDHDPRRLITYYIEKQEKRKASKIAFTGHGKPRR